MNGDMSNEVDRIFAEYCDGDICDAWYGALIQLAKSSQEGREWPESWGSIWSVWRHYWIWHNEGIESLWLSDLDDLRSCAENLRAIGEDLAANYLEESLAEAGPERLLDEHFTSSEEYQALARKWNNDFALYFDSVPESLAKFARSHRGDAVPILSKLQALMREGS